MTQYQQNMHMTFYIYCTNMKISHCITSKVLRIELIHVFCWQKWKQSRKIWNWGRNVRLKRFAILFKVTSSSGSTGWSRKISKRLPIAAFWNFDRKFKVCENTKITNRSNLVPSTTDQNNIWWAKLPTVGN